MKKKKILLVIPAYNEQDILEKNILRLRNFFKKNIKKYTWTIVLSDNASIDNTYTVVEKLAKKYKDVKAAHMDRRAMSYAIKTNWLRNKADIYMHMDADLSTDIKHIKDLLDALENGYDIATASRVSKKSKTKRNIMRAIISRGLISTIKLFFSTDINDFQCGFKAINSKVRNKIIPKMKAVQVGFMSTEMLVVAHKKGYKIKEIPVVWKDTRKSKSPIFRGILDALYNIIKIRISYSLGKYD